MSNIKQIRRVLGLGAVVAIALGLLGTAAPAMAQAYNDPVYELQQVLQGSTKDRSDPGSLKLREATLEKIIQQLRTVGELRRALAMTGWQDETSSYDTLPVLDARPNAPKVKTDPLADIDREARKKIGERLAKRIENEAKRGDATSRLALASLLDGMGTSVRALGDSVPWHGNKYTDWRGYAHRFTPLLVKLIRDDPDASVRMAAARALGKINPDVNEAVKALDLMLHKNAVPERRAAAEGLLNMIREIKKVAQKGQTQSGVDAKDEEILDISIAVTDVAGRAVEDRDPVVRRLSLATLVESAGALSSLIPVPFDAKDLPPRDAPLTPFQLKAARDKAAQVKQNEEMLAPLTKLLAAQGDRLKRALNDPDPNVRLLARRALELMANSRLRMRRRWESLPDLKAYDNAAASAAVEGNGPGRGVIFAVVQAKDTPDEGMLLKGVTPALNAIASQRFHDPNPVNRRATIEFLEMLEDAAAPAVPVLIEALSDPDIFVRWSAARTLGRINATAAANATPALARALSDPDLDVRLTAAGTLEAYGPAARAAIPALAEAVARGDPEFRRAVMFALQAIGPEASRAAMPNLLVDLRNDDPRVRRTAAETLGRFGPAARNAVPALRLVLQDEDADVRQAASDALLNILPVAE